MQMRAGTLIDYQLCVHGLSLRWRTLIKEWRPPHRFVDEQLRGPYRQWIHTHTFEPRDGGTLARDVVQYALPFDFITHPLFVRRDIEKILPFGWGRSGGVLRLKPPAPKRPFGWPGFVSRRRNCFAWSGQRSPANP